jgi:succinyl-CoA synthetase beta subunit
MMDTKLVTHQTGPAGQIVKRVYIESGCNIAKEYYFSVVLDRSTSKITFMASTEGGVDIEEVALHHPEKIIKISVDPVMGIQPFHCRSIAFRLGFLGDQLKQMMKIAESAYNAFIGTDASQIEINPLVVTTEGNLLALDAKINFDDNGLFRHPEIATLRDEDEEDPLETRASKADLNYVRMDGNIGCMVNGAGLAMATMDIIKLYGASPANFLDVGGGADKERVTEAFKIIMSDKAVKGILVNIFGGIMRCDIIAEGIIAAAKDVKLDVPLVVRLAGTNFELGKEILANSGLKIIAADDLADAAGKIVKAI